MVCAHFFALSSFCIRTIETKLNEKKPNWAKNLVQPLIKCANIQSPALTTNLRLLSTNKTEIVCRPANDKKGRTHTRKEYCVKSRPNDAPMNASSSSSVRFVLILKTNSHTKHKRHRFCNRNPYRNVSPMTSRDEVKLIFNAFFFISIVASISREKSMEYGTRGYAFRLFD